MQLYERGKNWITEVFIKFTVRPCHDLTATNTIKTKSDLTSTNKTHFVYCTMSVHYDQRVWTILTTTRQITSHG